MGRLGVRLEVRRIRWSEDGRLTSLFRLFRDSEIRRHDWAILQYTALGWSERGFPFFAILVAMVLKLRGVHFAILMHEPWHQGVVSPEIIDHVRATIQDRIIRLLYLLSDRVFFTIPLSLVGWVPRSDSKSHFVPLGPNIPEILNAPYPPRAPSSDERTVAVFCLSNPPVLHRELDEIAYATCTAATHLNVRVLFIGRGTPTASREIDQAFKGTGVRTEILGVREPANISEVIANSDALLCVRGTVNLRRSSALAGIACGVPVVGYSGDERGTPLAEAGLSLVPLHDKQQLGIALSRVLQNDEFAVELHHRNINAQKSYFSWDVVARQYIESLNQDER